MEGKKVDQFLANVMPYSTTFFELKGKGSEVLALFSNLEKLFFGVIFKRLKVLFTLSFPLSDKYKLSNQP